MNIQGALIGLGAFIVIGVFHPIVVKTEYYVGLKVWPVFFLLGIGSIAISLFIQEIVLSGWMAVFGFACLWSIRELREQVERVEKGWFPRNPNRP